MDPYPERPLLCVYLDPVEANIQTDVEKSDINSPDSLPMAATSEGLAAEYLLGTEDVQMKESPMPNLQDKNVCRSIVSDQIDADLSNLDP